MARKPRRARSSRARPDAETRAAALADAVDQALAAGETANPHAVEDLAARCLAAGDALRRVDRPVRAARMLQRSVDLTADPGRRTSARLLLAGVLADAGELRAATDVARQVLAQPTSENARVLGHDILASSLLGRGQIAEARGIIEALGVLAPQLPVLPFRRAALARLDGQLDRADTLLAEVLATAPTTAAWRGPRAAAVMERAEVALLQGDTTAAAAGFGDALQRWAAVARRSGAFRAEAGRVRAGTAAGQQVMPRVLDNPIDYAQQRKLPVLEAELRLARGPARIAAQLPGGAEDLAEAVALAARAEAMLLEGRCRLAQALHCGALGDQGRLVRCLAEDRVWSARIPR